MDLDSEKMLLGAVRSLAAAVDAKDPYTQAHSERVSRHAREIARLLGLGEHDVEAVGLAALMHDIGKIGIDDSILRKSGPLTDEEYEIMKTHPIKGAQIMEPFSPLKDVIPGVKYHHENVDGTGYPEGLKGDEIPYPAKIISVAETFDAMTTNSPHQKAKGASYVLDRMRSMIGTKFDAEIVDALARSLSL